MNFKTLTGATFAASLAFAPLAHAEIVIGLIAPLTGPVAAYGDQVKNGAQVAVDQINKNGGILGEQVVLKLADDAGEPTKRAFSAFLKAYESGYLIRTTGDIIALSPPLIISKAEIDELVDGIRKVLIANA